MAEVLFPWNICCYCVYGDVIKNYFYARKVNVTDEPISDGVIDGVLLIIKAQLVVR